MQKPLDINPFVKKQQKEYKDGKGSICLTCTLYNEDCFNTMKSCGKDEKTGWSTVLKCNKYKSKSATTADEK